MGELKKLMKIKNEEEFEGADMRLALDKIFSEEVMILDIDNIWDGSLSGFCIFNNKTYYFHCFERLEGGEDRWPRKYLLVNLSQEQLAEYNRFDGEFKKWKEGSISLEEYQKILDVFPSQVINKNQIVGWFDSGIQGGNQSKFIKSYFDWREKNQ